MSKPLHELDYSTLGNNERRGVALDDPPMAKAGRMVAYAIVILAGAILGGLGSLEPGASPSVAAMAEGFIIAAGALMMIYTMTR